MMAKALPSSTKVKIITQHPLQNNSEEAFLLKKQVNNPSLLKQNCKTKVRQGSSLSFDCFLKTHEKIVKQKQKEDVKEVYTGNVLDSSRPVRNIGKHQETPKKKIVTRLKDDIIKSESERLPTDTPLHYQDNLVNDGLNEAATKFLKKIVTFQENAYKRNVNKAKIKKRYIVGLHETKKYTLAKKVKFLIIAADLRIYDKEELLYKNILELKCLANENKIPYIFALKRSKIGNLTMKYRPVSCVGVLNYQSAEDELRHVFQNLTIIHETENESNENEDIYGEFINKLKEAILDCDKCDENN